MEKKDELLRAEDAAWTEVAELFRSLSPSEIELAGYSPEGWSVKDLLGHLAAWLAEAGMALEQIREGTYEPKDLDVDAMNEEFYTSNKDLPLPVVKAECWSARNRMLTEWNALPEVTEEAGEWFRESGENHYGEHLPRLGEWVGEIRSGSGGPGSADRHGES